MKDVECIEFLQWCLPRLRLRWPGFRKVHKQVCKRLSTRLRERGLSGLSAYQDYLGDHPDEWQTLDSFCQITISRFYRDRGVFDTVRSQILPALAENVRAWGEKELLCWSAGCCSGEEPYTLQIIWRASVIPAIHCDLPLRIIATDTNQNLLERAQEGRYLKSSLRDLPEELAQQAFERSGKYYMIRRPFLENIIFMRQDIREHLPEESFHLILCRNLVFTYFDAELQQGIFEKISEKLVPGGFLVIGIHEALPRIVQDFVPYKKMPCIYQKVRS